MSKNKGGIMAKGGGGILARNSTDFKKSYFLLRLQISHNRVLSFSFRLGAHFTRVVFWITKNTHCCRMKVAIFVDLYVTAATTMAFSCEHGEVILSINHGVLASRIILHVAHTN